MNETWDEIWIRKGKADTDDLYVLNGYERTTASLPVIAEEITRALDIRPGTKLLDVGCGAGALGSEIQKLTRGIFYVGTERSPTLVRKHITLLGNSVLNFSADEAVFSDSLFDCAVSFGVFHYFPSHAYAGKALREMLRQARNVFVGDLPVRSHDATHLLYGDEGLAALMEEINAAIAPVGGTCEKTKGLYNPVDRYNLVIRRPN